MQPTRAPSKNNHVYFPHIDGLRAIAVTSVVIYHLNNSWLPGGFAGVDIFFVISGFIVSASLSSLRDVSVPRFIALFYARRFLRIVPALIVCLLVTTCIPVLFIPQAWLSDSIPRTGLFAFFGLSNFMLAHRANNYFSPVSDYNPYTHTWSLGVEEQFYVIFPFLFFAWTYLDKRRIVTILFVIGFAASLICSVWWSYTDKILAFYMIPSRFWELAAGALLFQGMSWAGYNFEKNIPTSSSRLSILGATISLLLLAHTFFAPYSQDFPFPGAIPTVLGTLGLLFFLFNKNDGNPIAKVLTSKPVLFIGKLSYSLYLWHWPVIVLFRWTLGTEGIINIALMASITMLLSTLSFYCVEKPIRYNQKIKNAKRYQIIFANIFIILIAAYTSNWLTAKQNKISLSVTRDTSAWYPYGQNTLHDFPNCTIKGSVTPLELGELIIYSRDGCETPSMNAPAIYVLGDSHAGAYTAMLKRFVLETGLTVYHYTNPGCSFLEFKGGFINQQCQPIVDKAVFDMLKRLKPKDIVFLPSLRLFRYCDQWAMLPDEYYKGLMTAPHVVESRKREEQYGQEIFSRIQEKGAQIIFEAPKPIFKAPAFRCSDWFNSMNPACKPSLSMSRKELEKEKKPIVETMERLAAAHANVTIWDPFPILCPENNNECSAVIDGKPLFFDGDHLSGYGNMVLYPDFLKTIMGLLK